MAGEIPKNIKASLYIDGKPAEASLKNVQQVARTLERELNQLTIGTEAWNKKMAEVQANRQYLREIRDEVNGVGGAFAQLREELGRVGTLAAGYLGFQFITSQFQGIIGGNAKLSDSLADMRRVTGLTEAGVLDLDKSLGKLDTRTSKSDLRGIAVIAGKLGVAKSQILGFVEATDKLTVALGDELGNSDQITTQLGKILNVFDGKVTGDNITRLGNAMVKLANDGVASAGFIADFTQRVSGIAKTAGVSLPATLALGAGLEELGGRSESSATAIQKLLLSISSDTPKAAKIAGVSIKEFTSLLAGAPEQALLKYTKGLVANKNAFSEVTKSLSDAGEEGARTVETITKIGQNTDFFTGKIKDATFAIGGYNEINEAFNLKNQTLGAQVDKLGKDFNSLATNTTLVNFLTNLVILSTSTVKWLKENSQAIATVIKSIIILGAAWAGYSSVALIASTRTAIVSGAMAIARTGSLLYALAVATLTGNTTRAAAAQRLLGLSMVATPFGAALALVGALTAAYVLFATETTTAAKIQKSLNDVKVTAKQRLIEETDAIQEQMDVLSKSTSTENAKAVAIERLRNLMPDHLKGYTDVQIKAGKATGAVRDYIAALNDRYEAEARADLKKELKKKNVALSVDDGSNPEGFTGGVSKFFQGVYGAVGLDSQVKRLRNNAKAENQKQIASNNAIIAELDAQGSNSSAPKGEESSSGGGGSVTKIDKKAQSKAEKARLKAIADAKKLSDELIKISDELYANTLEKNEKEDQAVRAKYAKLEKEALGNKETLAKISALEEEEMRQLTYKRNDETSKLAKEAADKLLKEQDDVRKKIFEATATSYDLEVAQAIAKYDDLIVLAKKFGYDTVALEKSKQKALNDLADKKAGKKTPEELADLAKKHEEEKKDFYIGLAQDTANATFSIIQNSNQAKLNNTLKNIDNQRNAELANKDLTEQQKTEINAKYDAKVKEEKLKAFKAEQKLSIVQAIVNGALAVTKVMAQTGILSPFAIPAIIGGTLAQIAVIAAQTPPEYAGGGFSNNDPSGYVSNATVFNRSASGRPFVAGEAGKEWIAPNWMVQSPKFANIIGSLEVARQEKRMFANGGFNGSTSSSTNNNSSAGYDFGRMEARLETMANELGKIKNLKVYQVYSELEDFQARTDAIRVSQSA